MNKKLPPYAIAFYRPKIDFFEQKMASYWSLKDRIETESMSDSEIAQQFALHAAALNDLTDEVSCWLPSDYCDKLFFDKAPSDDDILGMYLEDFPDANRDIMAFVQEVKLRPGHFQGLIIDKAAFDEASAFLTNQKLKIAGVAATPETSSYPSPIIFPVETGRVIPLAGEDVAQDGIAGSVTKDNEATKATIVATSAPPAQIQNTAPAENFEATPEIPPQTQKPNSNRRPIALYGLLGVALIGLSSVYAYQKFDSSNLADAGTAPNNFIPNSDIEYIDEANSNDDSTSGSITDASQGNNPSSIDAPNGPTDEQEPLESKQFASLDTDIPSDFAVAKLPFTLRPDDHAKRFESFEQINDAKLNEATKLEDSPFKPDLSELNSDESSGVNTEITKADTLKITVPPNRNSQILQQVAKRIEAKQNTISGSAASNNNQGGASPGSPTRQNQLNLDQLALLGIYGPSGKPMAMLRSSGGRVQSVQKGEKVDGWQVVAISRNEVVVTKNGSQMRLFMPN